MPLIEAVLAPSQEPLSMMLNAWLELRVSRLVELLQRLPVTVIGFELVPIMIVHKPKCVVIEIVQATLERSTLVVLVAVNFHGVLHDTVTGLPRLLLRLLNVGGAGFPEESTVSATAALPPTGNST